MGRQRVVNKQRSNAEAKEKETLGSPHELPGEGETFSLCTAGQWVPARLVSHGDNGFPHALPFRFIARQMLGIHEKKLTIIIRQYSPAITMRNLFRHILKLTHFIKNMLNSNSNISF